MRARGLSGILLGVLMVGCSSGPPVVVSPTATPTPTVIRPDATPPPGFLPFTSAAGGYRACYPQGWQIRSDWVGVAAARGDAFIGGVPGDLPEVVSLVAEPAEGYDSKRYLEDVLANLRAAGLGVEDLGATEVNGTTGERLRFARLTATGQRYTVHQIVWTQDGRGWILAVSAPPAYADRAAAVIAVMLGCFRTL